MLIAAAVCPHPPLLVPEMTGSLGYDRPPDRDETATIARKLTRLRTACDGAVAWLLTRQPDVLAIVGGAEHSAEYPAASPGGLAAFGLPDGTGNRTTRLPLSLTIGRWLCDRVRSRPDQCAAPDGSHPAPPITPPGVPEHPAEQVNAATKPTSPGCRASSTVEAPPPVLLSVAWSASPTTCRDIGADLASRAPRVALLVMGDGTARRARGVPGAADPDAERYDATVAAALADADPAPLAALDPAGSAGLLAAGRAAWQVLAGAAHASRPTRFRGDLRYAATPFEVTYFVATWCTR